MKKKSILCFSILLILSTWSLFGQNELKTIRSGFKIGMTSSAFTRGYQIITDSHISPSAGIGLDIQLVEYLSVSLDALYVQQGATNLTLSSGNGYENIAIHGIDVPLNLNFYPLGDDNAVVPRIFAGYSFGFNLFSRSTTFTEIEGLESFSPIYRKSKNNINSRYTIYNPGVLAGGGLLIPYGNKTFSVDFSYRVGYYNITKLFGETSTNTATILFGFYF